MSPNINVPATPIITPSTVPIVNQPADIKHTETAQKFDEQSRTSLYKNQTSYENKSVAVEVDYRKYVDWFRNYNLNIRAYTPEEYVCGQYTVDMINASLKAGYNAYFASVRFSDGSGHALVSFKSTTLGFTSWYFFEPQTNKLTTQEALGQVLNKNMGKTVTDVSVYGYFDDAADKDPSTWRFAYPLYYKKY